MAAVMPVFGADATPFLAQIAVAVPQAVAAVSGSLTHAGQRDESLLLKTVLTEALGGPVVRPWRVLGVRDGTATILGYSPHDAAALRERLGFATPALQQAVSVVATAPLPTLSAGQRLRFSVRLVPTVRQTGKGEIDAMLYAVRQAPEQAHDRSEIYTQYLTKRLLGATVEAVQLAGARLLPMLRRTATGWAQRTFPVADMSGVLTVEDPGQLTQTLINGIGRQRGYGFGLVRLEAAH